MAIFNSHFDINRGYHEWWPQCVETWPQRAVFRCVKCIHWHCTCAMVLSLLCNHWQFLLGFSVMAKENQNQKKQETKKQKNKMTRPNSLPLLLPWGVQSCFFWLLFFFCFLVFGFLVSWFFGFLFSGSLLVFWRAKDLDLTLCLFSHCRGCKLAFGWFYYLLWAFGGLGTQIRQFCLFM